MNRSRPLHARSALIPLLLVVLVVLLTWPLTIRLETHLPGNSDDTLVHLWNGWWVREAISQGQWPTYTTRIFYPGGVSLITHNLAWFQIAPWLLIAPFLGNIAAYNVSLLLNLTLSALTCFFLARSLTSDWRAAFVASVIYLAWPYRLSQLDHPNLLAPYWNPLFLWSLSMLLRKGGWRYSLLTGIAFALVGYSRWQLLIPATLMGTILVVVTAVQTRENWLIIRLKHLIVAGIVSVVALLPPAWLLLAELNDAGSADLLRENEATIMQTDLLAFVTPGAEHSLLGDLSGSRYARYYPDRAEHRRSPAYVGLFAALLALWGFWRRRQDCWPWLLMALTMAWLAMGPLLRVDGQFYPQVPMIYDALPIVRLMRVPDRFNLFLALPLAIMAAYGMRDLLNSRSGGWAGLLTIVVAGLIVLDSLLIPLPVRQFPVSTFFQQMTAEPGQFALLNLPIDPLRAKTYMYDQTWHGQSILQGKIARIPDDAYAYLNRNPWLNSLRWTQEIDPALDDVGAWLAGMAEDNVRYIVLHKTLVGRDRLDHWQRYLLTDPLYEDDLVIVYTTQPVSGRDFQLQAELAPGLGPIRSFVSSACLNPGRVLALDVGWGTTAVSTQDWIVSLALEDADGQIVAQQQFELAQRPKSQWLAGSLFWRYYVLPLSMTTPAGRYDIFLRLASPFEAAATTAALKVGTVRIQSAPCPPPEFEGTTPAAILIGDELQLLAYRIRQEERRLILDLFWQPQQRMNSDYTVFVHVFDRISGVPMAQDDSRPRLGAYPTPFWAPGEVIADRVVVRLSDIDSGTYGVAIGVYDPVTGERLPVSQGLSGRATEDGRLILSEQLEIE